MRSGPLFFMGTNDSIPLQSNHKTCYSVGNGTETVKGRGIMARMHRRRKEPAPAAPLYGEPTGFYDQDHDADFEARQSAKARRRRSDRLYTAAMVVFAAIFLVSGGMLGKRFLDDRKTETQFSNLAAMIDTTATAAPVQEGEPVESNAAKFAALKAQNEEFIGWISIDGTNLDYPVMYSPTRENFYLKHDFAGNYSDYGVPYLDENCKLDATGQSDNLVVYGHNMKTGTIFGCLTEYKKESYYAQHPTVTFDTLYGDAEYEVFAAFAIDVETDQSFLYNEYLDVSQTKFDEYVAEVRRRSDVKTDIIPQYGDQLLTLSTCEYSTANGRYVVVARRVKAENA